MILEKALTELIDWFPYNGCDGIVFKMVKSIFRFEEYRDKSLEPKGLRNASAPI